MAIETEQIKIANRIIDRIKDEEGVYWYPLRSFFQRILFKKEMTREYRDSSLIRYMKVFEFQPYKSRRAVKTWCMSESGMKYILKRITVDKGKNDVIRDIRKKNLSEACLYFGIDRTQELEPKYIETPPKLENYDIWSLTCITHDTDLRPFSRWKKCAECNYYYPDSNKYFIKYRANNYDNKCKMCRGGHFKCDNKVLDFIYRHDGLDLIYALSTYDNEQIVKQLELFIDKGGRICHDDKCS